MTNDVWVLFKKGIPMDVYLSEESALANKFESEKVEHYIHGGDGTREEQLLRTNLALAQQVEELTRKLAKAERRMILLERLGGVPPHMRSTRSAA